MSSQGSDSETSMMLMEEGSLEAAVSVVSGSCTSQDLDNLVISQAERTIIPPPSQCLPDEYSDSEEETTPEEIERHHNLVSHITKEYPESMAHILISKIYTIHSNNTNMLESLFDILIDLIGGIEEFNSLILEYNQSKIYETQCQNAQNGRAAKKSQKEERINKGKNLTMLRMAKNAAKKSGNQENSSNYKLPEHVYIIDLRHCSTATREIIIDLIHNVTVSSNNHIFGEASYEFAFMLYFYSRSSLDISAENILTPSYKTIMRHFGSYITQLYDGFLNLDGLPNILETIKYQNIYNGSKIYGTIAIDAVKVDAWSPSLDKTQYNYLFVLYFMPLNSPSKKLVLATIPWYHGKATPEVLLRIQHVISIAKQFFDIAYVCTDGDRGYRELQQELFTILPRHNFSECLQVIANCIEAGFTVYITDVIHYAKNRRSTIIIYNLKLVVSPRNGSIVVSIDRILASFDIGDALTDTGKGASMSDEYAIALFSIPVMCACFQKFAFAEGIYIASVAFWMEAIRSPVLNKRSRLQMLQIAYIINERYYNILVSNDLPEATVKIGGKKQKDKSYFFAPQEAVERAMQSILATAFELIRNDHLNFSRMTTMSLEHLFGLGRSKARHRDDYRTLVRTFAELTFIYCNSKNNAANRKKIPSRDFQTGGTLNEEEEHTVEVLLTENELEIENIVDSVLSILGFSTESKTVYIDIARFLLYIDSLYKYAAPFKVTNNKSGSSKGAMIRKRLYTNPAHEPQLSNEEVQELENCQCLEEEEFLEEEEASN